jgi:nicotinamidase-related amidase
MRPTSPDLPHSAVLVIDMQEYFRSIAAPIAARLGSTIAELRTRWVPILYTQHGHENPARDGGMLFEWWDEHIIVGTEPWRLMPEVEPSVGDPVLRKKRYSAFFGTDLATRLRRLGVTDLIIGGVMTNVCCETTARDAFVRDYRVFVLTDGTASASRDLHQASLRNLGYGFATLLSCQQLLRLVRSSS